MKLKLLLFWFIICSVNGIIAQQSRKGTIVTSTGSILINETVIGHTYYDLQTNGSSGNRLVLNPDGTISACWNFSPDFNSGYPNRGTGYNFFDGSTWNSSPTVRIEPARTGFPDLCFTRSNKELIFSHSGTSMSFSRRPSSGTGAWTYSSSQLGVSNYDVFPRVACGGSNGETIHAIWQGQGGITIPIQGQSGPIFYSRSEDGGQTWPVLRNIIPLIDSSFYRGFAQDSYSIDARGDTVAIVLASPYTGVILLKSVDNGQTWTKTLIRPFPIPLFDPMTMNTDTNNDGVSDVILSAGWDPFVLLDHQGMSHVWFSTTNVIDDDIYYGDDALCYWNESYGVNGFFKIADAPDINLDGMINLPTSNTCSFPYGLFSGHYTTKSSAGIDRNGVLYVAYQTIDESADTSQYHQARRHIFFKYSTDNGNNWSIPFSVHIPTASGGNAEFEEGVFPYMSRRLNDKILLMYQRDPAPGTSLAAAGTCDLQNNSGTQSDIVFVTIDILLGINSIQNSLHDFNVFPNPASDFIILNANCSAPVELTIEITDATGRLIHFEKNNGIRGENIFRINSAEWIPGIYFCSLRTEKGSISKRLVLMQN